MKSTSALLVCLFATAPLLAQETVTTVQAVALPRATFRELASLPLANVPHVVEQHHALLPAMQFESSREIPFGTIDNATTSPIAAPPITRTIASGGDLGWAPADASGAVGKTHIVSALNSGIYVHDRSGATISSASLVQFWHSNAADGYFYDPRVAYDRAYDRWIIVSIYDEQSVMLAFSETGDPTGAWRRFTIQQNGADFSNLALTKDTVMFASCYGLTYNEGMDVYAIQKDALYASASTVTVSKSEFPGRDSMMLVRSDESTTEYILDGYDTTLSYRRLDATGQEWQSIYNGTSWQSTYLYVPQLSGAAFYAGSWGVDAAVQVNGSVYAVMTRLSADHTRSSILWCKLDPIRGTSEWGAIDDAVTKRFFAYPSLAVSKTGAMLIGFGIFSATAYPSAGYVYRDVIGRTSNVGIVRAGDTPYSTPYWGDYSATDVDPLDPTRFWTLQSFTSAKKWATAWAIIEPAATKRRAARH